MSEEKETPATETPAEETKAASGGHGKLIIIGVFVLLIVIAAGIFFTPMGAKLLGHEEKTGDTNTSSSIKEPEPEPAKDTTLNIKTVKFVDIPEILLNLRNASGKSSFLKITINVQAPNEEVGKVVEKLKPLLVDRYQEYLRGLDVEDLAGSAGIERVRSELLTRTNNVIRPEKATNILIPSMLIQ